MASLKGLSAVVTGGSSGLGLATVKKLLNGGCNVLVCDINKSPELEKLGDSCIFHQTDVSSESDATNAIKTAQSKFSGIDILVNCAGIGLACKTYNIKHQKPHPLDKFENVIRVNTIGTFNMIRLAALVMAENKPNEDNQRGVIVNTASVAGYEGQVGQAAYAASKAAIIGMTLPIARDLSREGIRVMTIAPGFFETPLMAGIPSSTQLVKNMLSPQRLGKPEEFAHLVEAIICNRMLNGEVIRLDGGARMPP